MGCLQLWSTRSSRTDVTGSPAGHTDTRLRKSNQACVERHRGLLRLMSACLCKPSGAHKHTLRCTCRQASAMQSCVLQGSAAGQDTHIPVTGSPVVHTNALCIATASICLQRCVLRGGAACHGTQLPVTGSPVGTHTHMLCFAGQHRSTFADQRHGKGGAACQGHSFFNMCGMLPARVL